MGSLFGGGNDVQAPDYSQAVQTLQNAAQQAASMGTFNPVAITTSFGTPTYTYGPNGQLTSASYTAAPWLQALQQGGQGLAGTYMTAAQQAAANQQGLQAANQAFGASGQLYGAAASALPSSYNIEDKTQEYYDRMQQLVAPERERQLATTRNKLFQSGRQGLAIGATQAGGQLATNPEMAAYYNAIAQQDLGLANQAEQQALSNLSQQQQMALGLFGAGLQQGVGGGSMQNQQYQNWAASQVPYQTALSGLNTMETMAQSPLQLGLQFGMPTMQGMQYGGNMIMQGAQGVAGLQSQQAQANAAAANANSGPGFWESLGGSLLNTGLNAGLAYMTGGGSLAAGGAGGLSGLFSGSGGGGGLGSLFGGGGGGFDSNINNLGAMQFANDWNIAFG